MSRILVTGAAGFIGSHVFDALHARGHDMIGVDDYSGGDYRNVLSVAAPVLDVSEYPLHVADCNDYETMLRLTRGVDTLVHCAANAREGASQFQPRYATKQNVAAYASVLSAAIANGVRNVILFSSMAVYGEQVPPFDENAEPKPADVYGCNKHTMERMTAILSGVHGFHYTIIRPHNVFGERQRMADKFRNVVAIFMNRILRNEPLFIYGDGEQTRAFSYIDDSLPCFLRMIEQCATLHGNVVNIGGIHPITVNTLAKAVLAEMGAPRDYPIDYFPSRPLEVKHAYPTYEKSVRLLSYAETIGWRDGVAYMAAWAKRRGPSEWQNNEPLEIVNSATPIPWLTQ